jgi:hypothetical protein
LNAFIGLSMNIELLILWVMGILLRGYGCLSHASGVESKNKDSYVTTLHLDVQDFALCKIITELTNIVVCNEVVEIYRHAPVSLRAFVSGAGIYIYY